MFAETIKLLPRAEYVYYADVLSCPLGNKTPEEIVAVLHRAIDFFVREGVPDAVVIACNTATGYGIGRLRGDLPDIPFFGVEPAVKPAAESITDGNILVLCTKATAAQDRFKALLDRHNKRGNIIVCPLGDLARVIEQNFPSNILAVKQEISAVLSPYKDKNIKGVVLGCTHYGYAENLIKEVFPEARIFDGNAGTARRIKSVLTGGGDFCAAENDGGKIPFFAERVKIFTTAGDEFIAKKYIEILQKYGTIK